MRTRGPSHPSRSYRYLLSDSPKESARLRAQARLWDPVALDLFARVGVARGWRALEIGPGQGSLHLALRRLVRGPVDAVEPSPVNAGRIRALAARDGFGAGQVWESLLADTHLPAGHYDLIFARWGFLFLPDPLRHVRQLVRALRPGGRLVVQDYQRETLRLLPTHPDWEAFLAADAAFFASQGGHASIGGLLPAHFERAGLTLGDVHLTVKTGHPGSDVWTWLSTYFLHAMPQLGDIPPFTPAAAKRLLRDWRAAARTRHALLVGPALVDVVGTKPRRRSRG